MLFNINKQDELEDHKKKSVMKAKTSLEKNIDDFDELKSKSSTVKSFHSSKQSTLFRRKVTGFGQHTRCKWMIIKPYNKYKQLWDVFATIALVTTCLITPVDLAFFTHSQHYP